MASVAVSHTKRLIAWIVAALIFGAGVSLYVNLEHAGAQHLELAREVGRTFFQALATMRDWNFSHKGIYLPLSADVAPNPDLVDPERDITSTGGMHLTKINHSQMIRMIAEMLDRQNEIHAHITSLTPIRAQNTPDPWEFQALSAFASHQPEIYGLQSESAGPAIFRYMAPLKVEESCLQCHHEHKNLDEIRGGISVSFSYAPFQQLVDASNRRIWLVHLLGLSASLIPIGFLGAGLLRNVEALQASLLRVRQLEGLVPICANCKKIRTEGSDADVASSWVAVERYIEDRTEAEFTHGICPECRQKLYPGLRPAGSK